VDWREFDDLHDGHSPKHYPLYPSDVTSYLVEENAYGNSARSWGCCNSGVRLAGGANGGFLGLAFVKKATALASSPQAKRRYRTLGTGCGQVLTINSYDG